METQEQEVVTEEVIQFAADGGDEGYESAAGFDEDDDNLLVDLSGVEEASFENVPKGVYECVISSMEYKRSESKNQPMWAIQLDITDGPYADRKLFTFISFSPKAMPFAKKTLNRIAPELLQGPIRPKALADEGALIGRTCRAKVDLRLYQGEKRSQVKDLLAPTAGGGAGGGFFAS